MELPKAAMSVVVDRFPEGLLGKLALASKDFAALCLLKAGGKLTVRLDEITTPDELSWAIRVVGLRGGFERRRELLARDDYDDHLSLGVAVRDDVDWWEDPYVDTVADDVHRLSSWLGRSGNIRFLGQAWTESDWQLDLTAVAVAAAKEGNYEVLEWVDELVTFYDSLANQRARAGAFVSSQSMAEARRARLANLVRRVMYATSDPECIRYMVDTHPEMCSALPILFDRIEIVEFADYMDDPLRGSDDER